jgi:hypothetical protein
MPRYPDTIPQDIDFAAQELLEAPVDQRPAMLEYIAKALTRRLLQDNPGIDIHEVSGRVTAFIKAVHWRVSHHSEAGSVDSSASDN